ncbi:MAG: hypothetical protein WCH77_12325 [Planctomycetota bacterium]
MTRNLFGLICLTEIGKDIFKIRREKKELPKEMKIKGPKKLFVQNFNQERLNENKSKIVKIYNELKDSNMPKINIGDLNQLLANTTNIKHK